VDIPTDFNRRSQFQKHRLPENDLFGLFDHSFELTLFQVIVFAKSVELKQFFDYGKDIEAGFPLLFGFSLFKGNFL